MTHLLEIVFAGTRKTGQVDLEAIEMLVRESMHQAGAKALGRVLSDTSRAATHSACTCGGQARYYDRRSRTVLTALGPVEYERSYHVCASCGKGHSPRDRELGVEAVACSPGVRRMMAVVGSDTSFEQGREELELLAGLKVTAKAVERNAEAVGVGIEACEQIAISQAKQLHLPELGGPPIPKLYIEMDGTGVPVVKSETEGRPGKIAGQPARTREVKLGCVFTQTTTDPEGRPVRDEGSTSYIGAIETAEQFGLRLYTEAWRRGWDRASMAVVLGDGAVWIWNIADQHFPGAIQIVDLYHAREHLWQLAAKLFPDDERARKRWLARSLDRLDRGKIEALVKILRAVRPKNQEVSDLLSNEADYFERNAHRMRYPDFRAQGLFVGSGVVEAGCKEVIGARLKRSGMFWTVRGANTIIALRCCRLSHRFEDYWADHSKAA